MVTVATTTLPTEVYATNGATLTGLKLNVLSNDQSNAPGNNTSGGEGNGGTASSSSKGLAAPTEMPRAAGVLAGSILMGALLL
jgi:1,3-beta-glucanosyltransferase GAS3